MIVPTQYFRLLQPAIAGACLTVLLTSGCETSQPWYRNRPEVAETPQPPVPETFLYTDFEPLNNWLDGERFEVEYRNMTPSLIFHQPPINDLNYETSGLAPDSEIFDFKSTNISRREILYRIAHYWALTMTIEVKNGKPELIRVEGDGDLIIEHAVFPETEESAGGNGTIGE